MIALVSGHFPNFLRLLPKLLKIHELIIEHMDLRNTMILPCLMFPYRLLIESALITLDISQYIKVAFQDFPVLNTLACLKSEVKKSGLLRFAKKVCPKNQDLFDLAAQYLDLTLIQLYFLI